ncbi:MAG: hypothetical protein J6113_03385 [Lachnospiraceae bacterium]|nr:hypothetical protein [Lachnospiraceae bacterium]
MKRIRITRKNFILTVIVGALVLLTFVIANTIHSSRQTIAATDEAVSAVSSFYLEAMADRRSKTVTNLINNNVDQMKKALDFIRDEGVAT